MGGQDVGVAGLALRQRKYFCSLWARTVWSGWFEALRTKVRGGPN